MTAPRSILTTAAFVSLAYWSLSQPLTAAEEQPADEDWGEDWDLEARIAAVNEGELHFVSPEAAAGHHVHFNRIRIDASSLEDGWVGLDQCHGQLDAVPATQIVYNPERIRNLRVRSAEGVGGAWVEGPSVQLQDVRPGARVCVSGESRALIDLGQGRYRLQNGPFMRRFLDGYYPMRVVLQTRYPPELLRFEGVRPGSQPGFQVSRRDGEIEVDATFEGRLFTCMDFMAFGQVDEGGSAPPCPAVQGPDPIE